MKRILFLTALFSLASTATVIPPFESGINEMRWNWDDWVTQGNQYQLTAPESEQEREEQVEEKPLVIERQQEKDGQRIEYRSIR